MRRKLIPFEYSSIFGRLGGVELPYPNRRRISRIALDAKCHFLHNVVQTMLGEFEYFVLSSAARLGDGAYGAAMRQDIESMTGRRCSIGALYTTLDRLERKGLIKTWMGEPSPERGGRAKKMVRITVSGIHAARAFYEAIKRVSIGAAWAQKGVTGE